MDYYAESPRTIPLAGRGQKEVDVYVEDKAASVSTIILVECKWWETNVPQDTVHAFHTVMQGSGANTGFIVSKVGFQSGALAAAKLTNINLVTFEELQHAYGDEWYRRQMSHVRKLELKIREHFRLHFDHMELMPIHNNMFFHTQKFRESLKLADIQCRCILLECAARSPVSYRGPEPVNMAWLRNFPISNSSSKQRLYEAATVREYFSMLREVAENWLKEFEQLHDNAHRSFDELDDEKQDEFFRNTLLEFREEAPIRALKCHLEDDEYKRLLKLLESKNTDSELEREPDD